ncbi:MAG: hypothetical protein M3R35_09045 [Candidatus Eremiobacteraeota bacterium]|nr:hypothetical protein [Candidatus Eremiobacteraeota bacterium]
MPGLRTAVAIACGYVVLLVMTLLGSVVIALLMFHGNSVAIAPPQYVAANAVLWLLAGITAGGLTARMAPSRPVYHAAALCVPILAIGVIAIFSSTAQSLLPHWYEPLVTALGAAGAVTGGLLAKDSSA